MHCHMKRVVECLVEYKDILHFQINPTEFLLQVVIVEMTVSIFT